MSFFHAYGAGVTMLCLGAWLVWCARNPPSGPHGVKA